MNLRLSFIILGLLLSNTISAVDNILILGDSLSAAYGIKKEQGWVSLLQHRLKQQYPNYQISNESTSGDTTANGLKRLPAAIQQSQAKIIIIELGANDGLRGLSLSHMQKNLAALILISKKNQAQVLLLGIQIPPNYGKKYTQAFAAVYPRLADKYALNLVPFMLQGVAGKPSLIQLDGLHPNAQAQGLILENIWPYLQPMLTP
jgi:acyl-CoA thioesterase I